MSRSFSTFVLSLLIVIGFVSTSFAQDENMPRPITKSGSAAFIFNLSGIGSFGLAAQPIGSVTVGTTNPTIVGAGMKYFFADDMALKVSLAFGSASNGKDTTAKSSTMQFGIGAILEYHFKQLYSTSPYIGGGINFGTASATLAGGTTSETKYSGTLINIGVVAGFDWFFTKGLALGAEYGLGFTTNSTSVTLPAGATSPTQPSPSGIGLGLSGNGSLHAVVYF